MKKLLQEKLSIRALELVIAVYYELKRFKTRLLQTKKQSIPKLKKLHLGSGARKVQGWLNVDLTNSDYNLDLTYKLPWVDNSFDFVVSQHFVEHLTAEDELKPLFAELQRVVAPKGEMWLTTPDLEKLCVSYLNHKCEDLVEDRKTRMKNWSLNGFPSQHFMNDLFKHSGAHRNLFDFELLEWMLLEAGFSKVERTEEKDLLTNFPEIPKRGDDKQALYVKVTN